MSSDNIQTMFSAIAPRYDLANAIMSCGVHTLWNRHLLRSLYKQKPRIHLDLCCGTGAIGIRLARKQNTIVHLLDFSPEMVEIATQRAMHHNLPRFMPHVADATQVPLPDSSVDTISIAYGVRNIHDWEKLTKELARVLRPGGTVHILELTYPQNRLMRLWLHKAVPFLGGCLTKNRAAYDYLTASIQQFSLEKLQAALHKRLQPIRTTPLFPAGAATLLLLKRPN
jgi:demethylmenaquinone methyltransferase / 2-methoxy-6-polyprenyl-1,4-benzoquinol methylase